MPGLLPNTRPLSQSYGGDMIDDRPVEDTERELGATDFNNMKADAAYVARVTPLLAFFVTVTGTTPVVTWVRGPEDVVVGDVTVTRTSLGLYAVDWSGTGVAGAAAKVHCHSTTTAIGTASSVTASGCNAYLLDPIAPALVDASFLVEVM